MKCPGQDSQYWNEDAIFEVDCPECGAAVEFYKDDTTRKCGECGKRFVNPKMDFGCAAYCQFAEQCIGTLPEEFVGSQDNLLKDKVAVEIKRYYGSNFKRIGHISRVARYAETIGKEENGNLAVLLCGAYLHSIGHGDGPEDTQEKSKELAEEILNKLKAKDAIAQAVCELIDKQDDVIGDGEVTELHILKDASRLAYLEESIKDKSFSSNDITMEQLYTDQGKRLAEDLLAKVRG